MIFTLKNFGNKSKKFLYFIAIISMFTLHANAQGISTNSKNCCTNNATITKNYALPSIDKLVGNYNNQVKIIFSDIDGTIVEGKKSNQSISQQTKDIVKKLKKENVRLVLVTGRPYYGVKNIAKNLGVKNSYIISQQGAEIAYQNGKILSKECIDHEEAVKVINFIENFKQSNNLTFNEAVFIDGKPYSTKDFVCPNTWEIINAIKSYSDLGQNYKVSKILIYEPNPKDIALIQTELKKNFPELLIDLGTSYFVEINSAKASKGAAVQKLAHMLKIDLKNAAVIGDGENDISMFKAVKSAGGVTIAVKNAMPKLKENACYETTAVYNDGFANAVDKILKNNEILKK